MQREKESADTLLETIRKELISINEEGSSEDYESNLIGKKNTSPSCDNESIISSASISSLNGNISSKEKLSSKNGVLHTSNISNINDNIQKLQNILDESHKTFQAIKESFENIEFGCLKDRIKDLQLNEGRSDSIKLILNDLKQSFDEKYMKNRIDELTKDISSKFRNHPGEFGDIPEISQLFRACSKLEHELVNLRQQREDCIYLQERMARVVESSYERVNEMGENVISAKKEQENVEK